MDPSTGGPPAVAASLAIAQQELGHEVYILSNDSPDAQTAINRLLDALPGGNKIKLIFLDTQYQFQCLSVKRFEAKLAEKGFKPDVMHLHGLWEFSVVGATRYARTHQIPYVIRPFGVLNDWSLGQKKFKKKIALTWYYKRMIRKASFLHMLNKDEADACASLGDLRFEIIPNGIFLDQINQEIPSGTFHKQFPVIDNKPYLLFVSRIHYMKGIDFLLDAFAIVSKKHPDLHLAIAGPESGAYQLEVAGQIKELGLEDRAHLIGPLYNEDKKAALNEAEMFCLTSRNEGFSMAVTEAMAYARPVIISPDCHFPEVAEADAGYVIELDAEKIAVGICDYIENPEKANQAGIAARKLIEDSYTWNRIAAQTIDCYEKSQK